jgi:hypothetical protein
MAQKQTITALKAKAAEHSAKAKEIQSKIRELESACFLQIGKLTADYQRKNWDGFDPTGFKKEIAAILGH